MRNRLTILVFGMILLLVPVISIYKGDLEYSEQEKRNLAQITDIKLNTYKDIKKVDKEVETYFTDQFPYRDKMVMFRTQLDIIMGKRESDHVYIGKDGYLIDMYSGYNEKIFRKNIKQLAKLRKRMKEQKIPFQVILVPSAVEILDNKLPAYAPHYNQEKLIQQVKKKVPEVVDITSVLSDHKEEKIYYKSDHHWTSLGAYYAYKEWRHVLGFETPKLTSWKYEVLCNNFRGTTWAKTGLPGKKYYDAIVGYYHDKNREVIYNNGMYKNSCIYETKYLKGKDQYGVFFNSNQVITKITGGGKKGKLLLVKDSYANTFAQFVLDDYKEIQMIDMRFFRGDLASYIEEEQFTDVLALYGCAGFTTEERRF